MSLLCRVARQRRVHARLRQAMQPYHARLERRVPLLNSSLSLSQVRETLQAFYGFYVTIEGAMESAARGSLCAEVRRRRKSQWLVQDLIALGETEESIGTMPRCTHLPPMSTNTRVLGSLYVLEGATLGGQMIARSLQKTLNGMTDRCSRFFLSYGENVGVMWQTLLAAITEAAGDPVSEQQVVEAACDTFSCFELWLAQTRAS